MNNKIKIYEIIELCINFDKLNFETKKIIFNSLGIETIDNIKDMNLEFSLKLYQITEEEFLNIKRIILNQLDYEQKSSNIKIETYNEEKINEVSGKNKLIK